MLIGGLLKFSLIDYPGKVAAVIFTQGCNYRCPFCHNPELVLPERFNPSRDVEEVFTFLEKRRGQIQGIVITGGEPTIHHDLKDFLRRIKPMGFLIKLDTNGSNPKVLEEIIKEGLVDLFAMDIKSSLQGYARATGVAADLEAVQASIRLIKASGVKYIFRTTAVKGFVAPEDVGSIMELIGNGGVYKLQRGNLNGALLDQRLMDGPSDFPEEEWRRMEDACAQHIR
jgi:pyruvate formate lyase activating enzyme